MPLGLHDFLDLPQQPGEIGRLPGYRVLRPLRDGPVQWEGPMFLYFRAEDICLQRPVTLKILNPETSAETAARIRFLRGILAMDAARHENVVASNTIEKYRGVVYASLEDLQGETLEQQLEREPILPMAEVMRVGRDIARGLAATHRRGLIHRGIQPGSVWLQSAPPQAKILDFSMALAVDQNTSLPSQPGVLIGTPAYMSPEQAAGEPLDPRSDLFGLGCLLYHLGTGRPPFKRSSVMATLTAAMQEVPTPPRQENPAIPAAVESLLLSLLAKDPAARPSNAATVAEELDGLLTSREA